MPDVMSLWPACLPSACRRGDAAPIEIAILAMFQNRPGICQFVPLDHHPPPIDFTASLLPSVSPRLALQSRVLLSLRPFASFFIDSSRSFKSLLFRTPPAPPPPFLVLPLFHFRYRPLFLALTIPAFSPRHRISLRTFSATFSHLLSSLSSSRVGSVRPGSFFRPARKKITEILRSLLPVLIRAFVPAATAESPAFFNEIP